MSGAIGRDKRARARHDRARALAEAAVAEGLPWLKRLDPAPAEAEARIREVFDRLKAHAADARAAREATDVLHDAVDAWNAAHALTALSAPPAITSLRARNPGWSLARLARLRRWRPWGAALSARLRDGPPPARPRDAAGRVIAAAIRHGGLGDPVFLAVLARWLAAPDTRVQGAEGLPLWIDLRARQGGDGAAGQGVDAPVREGLASRVRVVSGEDARGPYGLRRWFLDPDSLRALAAFFASAPEGPEKDERAAIGAASASRSGLVGLLRGGLDPDGALGPPPGLLTLIDGAFAEAEAAGPAALDAVTVNAARGRVRWASATPVSWRAAIRPPEAEAPSALPDLQVRPAQPAPSDAREDDETAARREARAFSALHALMAAAQPRRAAGLAAAEAPVSRADFARLLEGARAGTAWWPSAARLSLDWFLHLADTLRPSSVQRYHAAVSDLLMTHAGDLDLAAADAATLADLFDAAIEDDPRSPGERARARKLLARLHRFGAQDPRWSLAPVDPAVFGAGPGTGAPALRIAAALVPAAAFARARALIRTHPQLDGDGRLAVEAALILQRRCGLRVREVCTAEPGDLEETADGPVLQVRPTRYGTIKTPAARRALRPFAQMTDAEGEVLRRWVLRRRLVGGEGPLVGLVTPVGVAAIDPASLAALISEALRRACGHDGVSDHSLRHAALTDLDRALTEVRATAPHPLLDRGALRARLSGLTAEEAGRAAASVCPAVRRRDAMAALAAHAGHRSPATTVTHYLHGWDLRVFEAMARPVPRAEYDALCAALGERVAMIEGGTALSEPPGAAPGAGRRPRLDPVALVDGLALVEGGTDREDAAAAARLSAADVDRAVETARALAGLRTRKGGRRLFPGDDDRLAPHPPRSRAERREGRALMRELWALRADRADDLGWWCAAHLMRATRTNPGLRLTRPAEVERWTKVVEALSPRRWHLRLEGPPGAVDRTAWEAVCPPGAPWRDKATARSTAAIVRLPRPDGEGPGGRLARISDDYASGAPLLAAHGIAIALGLTPRALAASLGDGS